MLECSIHLSERLIKHTMPNATEEEIGQIIYTYNRCNPFHYPNIWFRVEISNPNLPKENIDQIIVNVVESS